MARRRIGQESFGFGRLERGRNAGLDELGRVIEWGPDRGGARRRLRGAKGGARLWPPIALFKALLVGFWHDLSDTRQAEALDDRASFRRFCGFSSNEATPERTAFVRFRGELVRRKLDRRLFAAVVAQIEAKGLAVRTGTLVDATVIRAASDGDGEAGTCAYARGGPAKVYKAHVAADEENGIVRRVAVTPANRHDGPGLLQVLPPRPGAVYADTAYDHRRVHAHIRAKGGAPMVARRVHGASRPDWNAAKRAWNAAVHAVRCRVEKIFGTAKRSSGSVAPAISGWCVWRCRCISPSSPTTCDERPPSCGRSPPDAGPSAPPKTPNEAKRRFGRARTAESTHARLRSFRKRGQSRSAPRSRVFRKEMTG